MTMLMGIMSGCHELDLMPSFFDKEEAMRQNVREAIKGDEEHSRLVGDYIKIVDSTLGYIKIQGVGLVTRLDGQGEDPPSSPYRTMILDDLRKREVEDPQTLLSSADTALVIVTAKIPAILRKGESIDVELTLPDGSEAKSIAGGWLMPVSLNEHALLGGQVRDGKELAIASGPILVNALSDKTGSSSDLRRGRIPAGARYVGEDRQLTVAIRNDYRTVRMSTQIANRIGLRFHDYDKHGIKRKMATAKSHAHLELTVHKRYRENYSRYLQCIRHMSLSETPVEKHMRLQELTKHIQFGPTSAKAALQLEAIGSEGIPILKEGLQSPQMEARFRAAEALAYLGNTDGVPVLQEAADKEPAFRIYALAALAVLNDGTSSRALTELMNHDSVETRYGAFRAFSTMAPNDPAIRGVEMDGKFSLHLIQSTAEPLVHLTRYDRAEVVLFGTDQRFQAPLFVRAGTHIMIQATPQGDQISLKRIAPNERTLERTVSTKVSEVIVAATELGATYPDIVQMLVQADRQGNLAGEIAIDTLPEPGRVYERPVSEYQTESASSRSVTVGGAGLTPNLFKSIPVDQEAAPVAPQQSESTETSIGVPGDVTNDPTGFTVQ